MAGNSARRGAIKKSGKGNPTAGSGGRRRQGLEGKGPTPKAKDREGHKAYKQRVKAEKEAAKRPQRRTTKSTDAEWVAGRNSVVEALRAHMPITTLYVAEGAERDGRLREAFKISAERGIKPAALGDVPSPADPPPGCHYHPRCAVRLPDCSRLDPPVVEYADGMCRCVLATGERGAQA